MIKKSKQVTTPYLNTAEMKNKLDEERVWNNIKGIFFILVLFFIVLFFIYENPVWILFAVFFMISGFVTVLLDSYYNRILWPGERDLRPIVEKDSKIAFWITWWFMFAFILFMIAFLIWGIWNI